jgi:hypothetical protein
MIDDAAYIQNHLISNPHVGKLPRDADLSGIFLQMRSGQLDQILKCGLAFRNSVITVLHDVHCLVELLYDDFPPSQDRKYLADSAPLIAVE